MVASTRGAAGASSACAVARTRTGSASRPSTSSRRAAPTSSPARSTSSTTSSVGRRARAAREIAARAAGRIAGAGGVQHDGAVAVHLARQLRGQPRLPHSARRRARARSARLRRARRATPRAARRARPDGPRAACPRRARPAAARIRAPAGRAADPGAGSRRAARAAAGPGSTPICSTSADRACRKACSACAWRPERYSASIRCACSPSRSGSRATSTSSSARTSRWRPAARSPSIARSAAVRCSSSRRRISPAANGSSATSASGAPRHSASASRGRSSATSAAKRSASTSPSPRRSSYPRPRVTISAPSPLAASALRTCETYSCTILAAVGGGSSPQSASTSRSLDTVEPSSRASTASSARGLPLPMATERPSAVTSTGPRTLICMCLPTSTLSGDGTRAPKPAQAAIYRRFYRRLTAPAQPPPRITSAHPEEVIMKSHRRIRSSAGSRSGSSPSGPSSR